MANINVNNNYTDMKNLTPFKLCVLQNFPFIEADFDAVTNYQLLCKVVENLNKVIDNNNIQNGNITQLEQNFITLYNYVNDYFDNLDVQDEINNKLDDLVSNGTLSQLIMPYVISTASPKFVDNTNKMTNINYTYVLSTNNHIYYYDGRAFTDSGYDYRTSPLYFSGATFISPEMSIDFNELITNRCYAINSKNVLNSPIKEGNYVSGTVLTFSYTDDKSKGGLVQIFIDYNSNNVYYRMAWGTPITFTKWTSNNKGGFVTGNFNFNTAENNSVYSITSKTDTLTNYPSDSVYNGYVEGTLITMSYSQTFVGGYVQFFIDKNYNNLYYRIAWGNPITYSKWISNNKGGFISGNFDFNSTENDSVYSIASKKDTLTNYPTDSVYNGYVEGTLITMSYSQTFVGGYVQFFIDKNYNNLYYRIAWGTSSGINYLDWNTLTKVENILPRGLQSFLVCGDSISVSLSYPSDGSIKEVKSWGSILAESINTNATVLATGGYTVKDFNDNYFNAAVENISQFAIVFLGINDSNKNTDIATFSSEYKKLIDGLLTNHKFVVCVEIPKSLQPLANRATYNDKIIDIVSNYENVFTISLEKYDDILTDNVNRGHLSSVGYGKLANYIGFEISKMMNSNPFFRKNLD